MSRDDVLALIRRERVVGIVRRERATDAYDDAKALLTAGLSIVEVSLTTPRAVDVIAKLARDTPAIGAGTVLTLDEVERVADAGAGFVVSPILDFEVVAAARRRGLVTIPAAFTPTEMTSAVRAGADLVKVFPASTWSPAAIGDVLAALPTLPLVPTGGIGLADARDWISAGAVAVGMGSALRGVSTDRVQDLLDGLEAAATHS
jgi:2-dehydro-3-deoxyphosphogluconate aldolase / (4S)-4-hydroxy-2-oxoglutarate aldolase